MKHDHEQNIKCPYCDWEDRDSWEFEEESRVSTCGKCGEDFNVSREIEVTYSTTRIDCEVKGASHNYEFTRVWARNRKYEKGKWSALPENEWTYYRVSICSVCGDEKFELISLAEYDVLLIL